MVEAGVETRVLTYAPGARRIRWRGAAVLLVLAAALTVLGVSGWRASAEWRAHRVYLRAQADAMAFAAPPSLVVYEEDERRGKVLLAAAGGGGRFDYRNQTFIQNVKSPGLANVVLVHPPMRTLGMANECAAYLGGRTSAGGNTRLVVVTAHCGFPDKDGLHRWVPLTHLVGTPATSAPASRLTYQSFIPLHLKLRTTDRLRLFAGQPDPADASHFTIGYELNDAPGTIDGYLQDDDRIKFQYRDGPATTRPTAYQF